MNLCQGCEPIIRNDLALIREKAGKYAKEKQETVIVFRNETGFDYCTAEYFYTGKPGQYIEGVTQFV